MKSLLYHAFGVRGYRYLRTRYEGGKVIFEREPEVEPLPPDGQKLARHGFRWRTLRTVSIGLKPVVLKVPRWQNTTTGQVMRKLIVLLNHLLKSPSFKLA